MSDNVISFPERTPPPIQSDDLRKATLAAIYKSTGPSRPADLSVADTFLAQLWADGFKVVPLPIDGHLMLGENDVVIDPSVPDGMILVKDQRAKDIVIAMVFKRPAP